MLNSTKGEPRNRPRRTHRVSGGIAQLFLNLGTRKGCVFSASRPGRLYPRERPGTHCTGGWVGPGAGLDRCGKSRPTGIRSPDLPACSESLYRLRYPGFPKFDKTCSKNNSTMTNGDIVPTQDLKVHFFFYCATPRGLLTVRASRSHTIRHTTLGRTPLDE
jgi:hypothetical protein